MNLNFGFKGKNSWNTELDIYCILMKSMAERRPYILTFIASDTRIHEDGHPEFWIVTEYYEKGSLHDYLKSNKISLDQLLKVSYDKLFILSNFQMI